MSYGYLGVGEVVLWVHDGHLDGTLDVGTPIAALVLGDDEGQTDAHGDPFVRLLAFAPTGPQMQVSAAHDGIDKLPGTWHHRDEAQAYRTRA